MRRFGRLGILALLLVLASGRPAAAAPVVTNATLRVDFLGYAPVTVGGFGTVSVSGSSVIVPAGLVSLGFTVVVPVTGTTAVNVLSVSRLSNLAGTFSLAGVTAQRPSEVCTAGPGPAEACNRGGGVGGIMGLTGTVRFRIVPDATPPVNLDQVRIGQGGSTNSPFDADAAAWTTGTASAATASGVQAFRGAGSPFQLVTPTYVSALGIELPIVTTFTLTNVSLVVPESSLVLLLSLAGLGYLLAARR